MIKIVIAIDSFKGSLTSLEAGQAAAEGICRAMPEAETKIFPVADGGEGTVDALVRGLNGRWETVPVSDPLGRKIQGSYGIVGNTAVLEMSAAAGITLITQAERNPLYTTTYGVGELTAHGIGRGCRDFLIGIGGSATNDGGIGMLRALGFEILDDAGNPVPFGAIGLSRVAKIRTENALPALKDCRFRIACDVENPLCGTLGSSRVYGPQKGADEKMVEDMDRWLSQYASVAKEVCPWADPDFPGAGAAGGLGFALRTFLGGELTRGISLVLDMLEIEKDIRDADFVITGEGRLDAQTVMGKTPAGVAEIAAKYQKPVIAFAGSVSKEARVCNQNGIAAYFPILQKVCTLDEAMKKETAYGNLAATAEQAFRLLSVRK